MSAPGSPDPKSQPIEPCELCGAEVRYHPTAPYPYACVRCGCGRNTKTPSAARLGLIVVYEPISDQFLYRLTGSPNVYRDGGAPGTKNTSYDPAQQLYPLDDDDDDDDDSPSIAYGQHAADDTGAPDYAYGDDDGDGEEPFYDDEGY